MKIAVIGAGNVGRALGARLVAAGEAVVFGARDPKATQAVVPAGTTVKTVADAVADADIVMLAVPAGSAVAAARAAGLRPGTVLVDGTNPLRFDRGPVWTPPAEGSVAQAIAAACPAVRVVKAFNHFGAEIHADPQVAGQPADAMCASDDDEAKAVVMALATRLGFRPMDAGGLRNAGVLENLAVLWIHLALVSGAGRHVAFRLVGREGVEGVRS